MARVAPTKQAVIKRQLITAIRSGELLPGEKLAGGPRLAKKFGVSAGTMQHVLMDLEREGLVRRRFGSGTYVENHDPNCIDVHIPLNDPRKVLLSHLWGKLQEYADLSSSNIRLLRVNHPEVPSGPEKHRQVVSLFTGTQRTGLFEITMNDLAWLVETGLCLDLSDGFAGWSQQGNLYDIARQAVTVNGRIFGLPFHSTLTCWMYHKEMYGEDGAELAETVGDMDGVLRLAERLARRENYKHPLRVGLRCLLTLLLRSIYGDVHTRFVAPGSRPVERDTGVAILEAFKRLRWQYRVYFDPFIKCTAPARGEAIRREFALGRIPVTLGQHMPRCGFGLSEVESSRLNTGVTPWRDGSTGERVSLFNCYVWIINPLVPREVRDFLWGFLSYYVQPESEYELDRKHLESSQYNQRSNSFIRGPKRVPRDEEYEMKRQELFGCAERELPFPVLMVDRFGVAADRMIRNPDSSPRQEYESYLAACESDIALGQGVGDGLASIA